MSDEAPGAGHPFRQPDDPAGGTGGPSPFSREGAGEAHGGGPEADPRSPVEPGYEPPPAGGPDPASPWRSPGQGPQSPYGQPSPLPGQPAEVPGYGASYGTPGPGGGLAAYGAGYGGWSTYGASPVRHPQATAALVTGILAAVLGIAFAIGGLIGIASLILGAKVRREIDSDPARYTGRGSGSAGILLGIVGILAMMLWIVLFTVAVGVSSS